LNFCLALPFILEEAINNGGQKFSKILKLVRREVLIDSEPLNRHKFSRALVDYDYVRNGRGPFTNRWR
jgi:hypothetical protein